MSQTRRRDVIRRPRRSAVALMFVTGTVALSALAGCSPLPGASFDPMYFKLGSQGAQATSQTATPAPSEPPRVEAKPAGATSWVGRYQDSRGSGDIAASLVQGTSTVSGTWQLRTGGGGPLTGVPEPGGRRLQLRMENTARECPGLFEGWMEISEKALVGTYQGKDCEGPVSNGRLELHPK
jgi:hypothetical protein